MPLSPGCLLRAAGRDLCSFHLQAYAMNYWRKLGAPSEKLIMGFPTYGRTFHLLKASSNGLQAKAIGPASPGKYTKQAGFLAYYEVMDGFPVPAGARARTRDNDRGES